MPIVIDEFEVVAEPAPSNGSSTRGTGTDAGPPDARPAQMQLAIEQWQRLQAERALRLDDR